MEHSKNNVNKELPPIALIGGEGVMPQLIIDEIHNTNRKVFLLGMHGSTSHDLAAAADDVVWLHITQLGKAIKECLKRNITEIIMAGRVQHKVVFSLSLFKMDWTTLKLWWNLPDKRTDTILHHIANLLEEKGITLLSSVKFLKSYLAKEGLLNKCRPSKKVMEDITFGTLLAKEIGRLDIGQTVIVKNPFMR